MARPHAVEVLTVGPGVEVLIELSGALPTSGITSGGESSGLQLCRQNASRFGESGRRSR